RPPLSTGQEERDQVVQVGRGETLPERLRHDALAVGGPIVRSRDDVGVRLHDGLADVSRRIARLATVVTAPDDARGFGGDVAQVRADVAARELSGDVMAGGAWKAGKQPSASRRVAAATADRDGYDDRQRRDGRNEQASCHTIGYDSTPRTPRMGGRERILSREPTYRRADSRAARVVTCRSRSTSRTPPRIPSS